ncbi:MAG: hypothetical protein AB8G05_16055 [Oligoflexales bacterium]
MLASSSVNIGLVFIFFTYLYGNSNDLSKAESRKNIPAPTKKDSYEGMLRKIRSFSIDGHFLRYIGGESKFLITSNLQKPKNEVKPFSASKKTPIDDLKISKMNLISMFHKNHYLILNGNDNEVYFFSPKNTLISRHSIPYDLVRPPRDRGGEAPEWEISDLRRRFKKNFSLSGRDKFTGITKVPKQWMNSPKNLYFVASRIKGFPILVLGCNPDNPSQCSFYRACVVEGAKFEKALISGVTTVPSARLILLGRKDKHSVEVFRYNSCMHITKKSSFGVSRQLKEISNIFVDNNRKLWISTLQADDYFNASIFSWEEDSWYFLAK